MDEFKVFVEQCFNQEPLKNIWEEYHVLLWHVTVILCSLIAYKLHNNKRYFIIDHQIARHFLHYSECSYHPLPFYATQMITPLLSSRISANQDKGLGF